MRFVRQRLCLVVDEEDIFCALAVGRDLGGHQVDVAMLERERHLVQQAGTILRHHFHDGQLSLGRRAEGHACFNRKVFELTRQAGGLHVPAGTRVQQLIAHGLLQRHQLPRITDGLPRVIEHNKGVECKAVAQGMNTRVHDGQVHSVKSRRHDHEQVITIRRVDEKLAATEIGGVTRGHDRQFRGVRAGNGLRLPRQALRVIRQKVIGIQILPECRDKFW